MRRSVDVKKLATPLSLKTLGFLLLFISFAFAASSSQMKVTLKQFKNALATASKKPGTSGRLDQRQSSVRLNEDSNPELADMDFSYRSGTSSSMTFSPSDEKQSSSFSGKASYTYSRSAVDHRDGSLQANQSLAFKLIYSLSEDYTSFMLFSADQDLRDSETKLGNGISDIVVGLSHKPWELASWVNGTLTGLAVLPTSEYSTRITNLQTTLGVSYTFDIDKKVLPKSLETSLTLGAARNFHQYETNRDGSVLNPYSLKEVFDFGYTLNDQWSASFEFIHRHAWDYYGKVSEAFEMTQEVALNITPKWSVSAGHTNSGAWLRPNEQDMNLKLFNENDSIFYVSSALKF